VPAVFLYRSGKHLHEAHTGDVDRFAEGGVEKAFNGGIEQAQGLQGLTDGGAILDRPARLERERTQQPLRGEAPAEVAACGAVDEDGVLDELWGGLLGGMGPFWILSESENEDERRSRCRRGWRRLTRSSRRQPTQFRTSLGQATYSLPLDAGAIFARQVGG
jgi:hypothetical protein